MLLLADGAGFAARIAGTGTAPRPVRPADLAGLSPSLLPLFFPGGSPAVATDVPGIPWPVTFAVTRAPGSQFDLLAGIADAPGALPERLLAVAGEGDGFHGQRGRPWVALAGNLHLVAFARVDLPAATAVGPLAALPAVSVTEAIDSLPGLAGRAGIKWVNDVLLEGRKAAGVLARTWTRGDRVTGLLLGIGLDVEATPSVDDDPLARGVTSLADAASPGPPPSLAAAFRAVARSLAAGLDLLASGGGPELVARYRERSVILGREVLVTPDPLLPGEAADEPIRGRVEEIGDQLELRLAGRARPVLRGRLRLLD